MHATLLKAYALKRPEKAYGTSSEEWRIPFYLAGAEFSLPAIADMLNSVFTLSEHEGSRREE